MAIRGSLHQHPVRLIEQLRDLPSEMLIKVVATLPTMTVAQLRDAPALKEHFRKLSPTDLSNIQLPEDLNTPLDTTTKRLVKPLIYEPGPHLFSQIGATLTSLALLRPDLRKKPILSQFALKVFRDSPYTTYEQKREARIKLNLAKKAKEKDRQSQYRTIALGSNRDEKLNLARKADLPPEQALVLAKDKHPPIRESLAANRFLPSAVMEKLAKDESCIVRIALAKNKNIPPSVLVQLTRDQDPKVRFAVAKRSEIPYITLKALIHDSELQVKACALEHPDATEDDLACHASHSSFLIRAVVAGHHKSHIDDLQALCEDIPQVRRRAAGNPHTPRASVNAQAYETSSPEVQLAALQNPVIDSDVLWTLATNQSNSDILIAIANNPCAPLSLIEHLCKNPSARVREAGVLSNRLCERGLEAIASDPSPLVRRAVAKLTRSPAVLRAIFTVGPQTPELALILSRNPQTPSEALSVKSGSSKQMILAFARHTNAPGSVLQKLASHHWPAVRVAVAANGNTPLSALVVLAQDVHPAVQTACSKNPTMQSAMRNVLNDST